jgi:transposase
MGLNLSNKQIAKEFDLNHSDVYQMVTQLREGDCFKKPPIPLQDTVEFD